MEEKNKNVRIKICPQCKASFACCIEKCWCSELPMIMPLSFDSGCYCPQCLKGIIQDKMTGNENIVRN